MSDFTLDTLQQAIAGAISQVLPEIVQQLQQLAAVAKTDAERKGRRPIRTMPFTPESRLTEFEACDLRGVSVSSLRSERCKGVGPLYEKDGNCVLYRYQTLIDWMAENTVKSTADAISRGLAEPIGIRNPNGKNGKKAV